MSINRVNYEHCIEILKAAQRGDIVVNSINQPVTLDIMHNLQKLGTFKYIPH